MAQAGAFRGVEYALYRAQRHAGSFGGDELRVVATFIGSLAIERGLELVAVDGPGDRIVGTASALTRCALADTSRRLDGKRVLLVAGMLAGPYGLIQAAAIARSIGAAEVHAAHLGGWHEGVPDCDSVHVVQSGGLPVDGAAVSSSLLSFERCAGMHIESESPQSVGSSGLF